MKEIEFIRYKNQNLLCNFENGAVVQVEESEKDQLENYLIKKDSSTKNLLMELGFYSLADLRKQAYLHITHRCNLDCIGCYSRISNRNQTKDLSLAEIQRILEELNKHSYTDIIISGGEPMIRKDLLEILKMIKEKGFNTVMITNGSISITDEILENLDSLAISIDEMDKDKNELGRKYHIEKIIEIQERAKSKNVPVNGIITLNHSNIDQYETYDKWIQKHKLPISYSLFYSNEKGSKDYLVTDDQLQSFTEKNFKKFSHLLEGFNPFSEVFCKRTCGVAEKTISVDAEGNLCPCHMMHKSSMGSLLENPENAWKNLQNFRKTLLEEENECESCEKKVFCGRGCIARSQGEGGTKLKDPYCKLYDTYFEKQFELLF